MYFKKLEINGFKSFAEKTTLHFEPGITAIVGPNGCGKSNVFDSIRWCLGEQSIKSLRGSKMEDVIFNGTEKIPPQNLAEVSLTISNEAKILPIEYEEVKVTRRLFRSGESEYLLNNSLVRLKDIVDLLLGTGIGAESYSLIEQGKIDLVISSKPEDRRFVFDEATGVSKYKAKKREALRRLEETDNNLFRVNDIMTEVKRQIGSIERQAAKARRYKEFFERLKTAEIRHSALELKSIKTESTLLGEMTKRSQGEELKLNATLGELDKKLITQQRQLQDLDANLTQLKEALTDLENIKERNTQHIAHNHERILDLHKHGQILLQQKGQLEIKIEDHKKNMDELNERLLTLHETYAREEEEFKEKETRLSVILSAIEDSQRQMKELKARIFDISVAETRMNNELNELTSNIKTFTSRQKRLEAEKLKTDEEKRALIEKIDLLKAEIGANRERITLTTQTLNRNHAEREGLLLSLRDLTERLRALEDEQLSLHSQAQFLKELKSKYDNIHDVREGLLHLDNIPEEHISGIIAHVKEIRRDETTGKYSVLCELKFISFDLEKIEARIGEAAAEAQALTDEKVRHEDDIKAKNAALADTESQLQDERFELSNREAALANLAENAKKIHDELSLVAIEYDEIEETLRTSLSKQNELASEQERVKAELATCEAAIQHHGLTIEENSAEKESMLVEITQLRTEMEGKKTQEESLRANLSFFQNSFDQDSQSLVSHDQEIEDAARKSEDLKQEIAALEEEIKSKEDEKIRKIADQDRFSQMRTEEVNSLDFTQKQIIDAEERMDKIKEDIHRSQMQEQEINFKLTSIKSRIQQSYNVDLEELPEDQEETLEINAEQLAEEITALKDKVESFGTVNLVAIEELEELKNRFEFLTQQNNDLMMGKDSLHKAILKINRTTRKMFLETFQAVAEEFKNYFRLLFGGGDAKLFLIDEEDVLESGIEIICRPPGKKLQNITLLSGGEKTLAAIALIFAIFKTKPSPFCVLDEIDAALDESNIDRFSRMLKDFSKTSQFIVITHNKKTISRANVMYGVTMERSGVSKTVSVKLHENRQTSKGASSEKLPSSKEAPQVS